jgi:hypothetical protein
MSAIFILGLTIIAGAVIGLGVLQLAHELIIRRLYSAPLTADESIQQPATLLKGAATGRSATQ